MKIKKIRILFIWKKIQKTIRKNLKRKKLKNWVSIFTFDKKVAKGLSNIDYYKAREENIRMYEFFEKETLFLIYKAIKGNKGAWTQGTVIEKDKIKKMTTEKKNYT